MHQAILMRAQRNSTLAENLNLRFIRSSSASLPPAVFDKLKDVFNTGIYFDFRLTCTTSNTHCGQRFVENRLMLFHLITCQWIGVIALFI